MTVAKDRVNDAPATPSIDPDEVAKFSAMAADWWNPRGKFRPLHKFNPVRLRFIRETAERHFNISPNAKRPLEGLRLLDIGCGGGLVCEPMTRLGASVTGVDASEANIKTALTHAQEQGLQIDYRAGTAEGLIQAGEPKFDIVLNLEVVEHVADPHQFLKDTGGLVKPGGLMIVATLNRTAKALATAVIGAEYVLGWLPRGTHDWSKFVTPEEADAGLTASGLITEEPIGVSYNPLGDSWKLSGDTKVNYMIVARRPAE
ncbi:bifunctional 2-polyprenyl-6-hydroxyphenol methylase/3-demethylubiquinol 3-O-methyltransferase UbiG [Hyphomonas atlantica corrig.]|uniref:bifunctional 2-polyprenyl-6-hydroxyphenol methylase/3-demethylubiquinol 3-O-methyltransferase UbiG n=1 Tax=Hyphomonas atlantica TaxID=1280948 RepID=UPI002353A39A|nr:bifunctional 2-polyprenyl-6-hydroxyphenol methylase/3-demethylubiquinol 3-O-methyltransferase UbiG [Hyphomonas atlantica]